MAEERWREIVRKSKKWDGGGDDKEEIIPAQHSNCPIWSRNKACGKTKTILQIYAVFSLFRGHVLEKEDGYIRKRTFYWLDYSSSVQAIQRGQSKMLFNFESYHLGSGYIWERGTSSLSSRVQAVLEDAINNGDCSSRSSSGRQTSVVSDQSYNPSQGFKAH